MKNLIINTNLTFKEYFKLILRLRLKSIKIIWDLCWLAAFPYLTYLAYNDHLKNPSEIKNIVTANIITLLLLIFYPIYIYYIYRKSYFSGENILRENILVEFDEVKITFKTEFSTNTIENEKINKIKVYDSFVTIDFYQNFIVINRRKLTKLQDKELIERINKIKLLIKKPNG